MSGSCKISKTLKGSAEKNYYLIKYIKSELEKKGLNPTIHLVISNEEKINLFQFPNMIPDTLRHNENKTQTWNFTDFFKGRYKSPIDLLFKTNDSQEPPTFNEPIEPNHIKNPYARFKEIMDKYVTQKKGGGKYKELNYKLTEIKIEIEV
jgi:hypothetical protein